MGDPCELYIKRTRLLGAISRLFNGDNIGSLDRLYKVESISRDGSYIRVHYRDDIVEYCRFGDFETYASGWEYPSGGHYFINNDDDLKLHCSLLCQLIKNTIAAQHSANP